MGSRERFDSVDLIIHFGLAGWSCSGSTKMHVTLGTYMFYLELERLTFKILVLSH